MSAGTGAAGPPLGSVRAGRPVSILSDHHINQLPWWSQRVVLVKPPSNDMGSTQATVTLAWRVLSQAWRYDAFVSANVRNALILGLFKRVTGRKTPAIVMTEMRLDDPRPGARWRFKVALQRYAYAAVDAMCVSARQEIDVYADRLRVPVAQFRFIPWHTNVLDPRWSPPNGGYLFAAGRTGRDWRTLAEAVTGLDVPVTVVCSRQDAEGIRFPANVTVLADIPYERYRELLEGATAVLVPLEPHGFSSGQVVVLEAMAYGKPVIATRVLGTEDYIRQDIDGMLVEAGRADELRAAIDRLLSSAELTASLGQAALQKIRTTHTLEQYARTVIGVVEDLPHPRAS